MIGTADEQKFSNDLFGISKLEETVEWVRDRLLPEDIFEQEQLETWAESNGFIKE